MAISKHWGWAALPLVVIGVGLPVAAAQLGSEYRGYAFLGVLVLLAAELGVIGWLVNERPIGAFVDSRNCLSLSKLQAGAWTVVVLSALATIAVFNILAQASTGGSVTDLDITIPGELLLAMGISATSLVAAPALMSVKVDQDPTARSVAKAARRKATLHTGAPTGVTEGIVPTNAAPRDASWANLVTGDEVGNFNSPDLGKIQQLLITVLLLGCYTGYVFINLSTRAAPIHALPALDKSFVWLLGISHASYLAYKAAPHTETK